GLTADVRVTGLAAVSGTLALLTYAPSPPRSPIGRQEPVGAGSALASAEPRADLATFILGLAIAQGREDFGGVLVEASEKLMGSSTVLLMTRRVPPPGTEVQLSAGVDGPGLEAMHRWLDLILPEVMLKTD